MKINTTTHADDTTVLVDSNHDMSELIKCDKNNSEGVGVNLNLQRTRVMRNMENVNFFLTGEVSSTVTNYKLLIVLITHVRYANEDIKKRISLGKATMANFSTKHKRLGRFNQHRS
jgi:hypothetical protein